MAFYYEHPTKLGPVRIVPNIDNARFEVIYDNEGLGSYHSPAAAADDVALNATFSPSNAADFEALGVSGDIGDWNRYPITRS